VLPEAQSCYPAATQGRIRVAVALSVSAYFRTPKYRSRAGNVAAFPAAMPEAPVDKHRDPLLGEIEVGASKDVPVVHGPAAYSGSHELETKLHFSRPVA
jgi:hypothetical protein